MAKTAATHVNPEDKPMFMQDITKLTTEFALVSPLRGGVIPAPVLGGIVAGTLVESETGWLPVENLRIGDKLQTLDGGLARVHGIDRRPLLQQAGAALIRVPGGLYDACSDVMLVAGQHVLIDTLNDPDHPGPYALVPAGALICDPLVRQSFPDQDIDIITPLFADEEVIFANSGVMLHCPSMADGAGRYPEDSFCPRLETGPAREFLTRRAARLAM
jgi:hypothetical protein